MVYIYIFSKWCVAKFWGWMIFLMHNYDLCIAKLASFIFFNYVLILWIILTMLSCPGTLSHFHCAVKGIESYIRPTMVDRLCKSRSDKRGYVNSTACKMLPAASHEVWLWSHNNELPFLWTNQCIDSQFISAFIDKTNCTEIFIFIIYPVL